MVKQGNNPMHLTELRLWAMRQALRCGAQTRSGNPCQSPAVKSRKRCRMHGGTNNGAPPGKRVELNPRKRNLANAFINTVRSYCCSRPNRCDRRRLLWSQIRARLFEECPDEPHLLSMLPSPVAMAIVAVALAGIKLDALARRSAIIGPAVHPAAFPALHRR